MYVETDAEMQDISSHQEHTIQYKKIENIKVFTEILTSVRLSSLQKGMWEHFYDDNFNVTRVCGKLWASFERLFYFSGLSGPKKNITR